MIRLQVVTEKWDPISAAIRFKTDSWASHSEFIDTEARTTLGARYDGVKIRPCSKDHYSRIEQFTAANITHAYEWALTQVGKPYDFGAIANIAMGMMFPRNWRSQSRWWCSELNVVSFEKVGSPILSTRPSASESGLTPRDELLSRLIYYLPDVLGYT
jgi:uncharacterized protein YycO